MSDKQKRDRITLDITDLRERIEAARSEPLWKELSLSRKIRNLLQTYLEQLEKERQQEEQRNNQPGNS